jgi:hypothetical protein
MKNRLMYFTRLFLLFLVTLTLLTSCKSDDRQSALHSLSKIKSIQIHKEFPPKSFYQALSLPISIPKGEFSRAIGWLSNDEFVYMSQSTEGTNLYCYNLKSGKSKILYESKNPIVSTLISPDQAKILIHSSPSTFEGQMNIIDLEGTELFTQGFPSVEMVFEWNQYAPEQLFITAFK